MSWGAAPACLSEGLRASWGTPQARLGVLHPFLPSPQLSLWLPCHSAPLLSLSLPPPHPRFHLPHSHWLCTLRESDVQRLRRPLFCSEPVSPGLASCVVFPHPVSTKGSAVCPCWCSQGSVGLQECQVCHGVQHGEAVGIFFEGGALCVCPQILGVLAGRCSMPCRHQAHSHLPTWALVCLPSNTSPCGSRWCFP